MPAARRYQEREYSYTAGNSPTSIAHFAEPAGSVLEARPADLSRSRGRHRRQRRHAPVRDRGDIEACAALNIEPSSNIAELANQAGGDVETIVDLWSMDIAHHIASERGSAQIITATNVLNHASDPMEFVAAVEFALDEDGVFVFEVPSLRALVKQRSFDTIYLEHISYFGVKAILHLLGANGLRACHIQRESLHGRFAARDRAPR